MTTSRITALSLAALLTLVAGSAAEAQLGGLIKKKVAEAVKGPEKPEPAKDEAAKQGFVNGNSDVLEITPPVLEGFVRGLNVEIALRKEFAAELAKYPTREQYAACQANAGMSEEAQKLFAQLDLPETATEEQQRKAMEKYTADVTALLKRRCPLNPAEAPDRAKRLAEIQVKAAEAAGPEVPGGEWNHEATEGDNASGFGGPHGGPWTDAVFAAGLTPRQYAILLERIKRFCDELKAAGDKGLGGSGGVTFPGSGAKIFWVYTAAEAQTLSQANCQRVYDLIGQLL